jgi:hypothetical protein
MAYKALCLAKIMICRDFNNFHKAGIRVRLL